AAICSRADAPSKAPVARSNASCGPAVIALPPREASSIDLAEHDVERAQDGRDVGQQVPLAHEFHGLKVRKARRTDLALVGLVGAVGDEIDAELALRRLDRRV